MVGFEPRRSGVDCDRSAHSATTTTAHSKQAIAAIISGHFSALCEQKNFKTNNSVMLHELAIPTITICRVFTQFGNLSSIHRWCT